MSWVCSQKYSRISALNLGIKTDEKGLADVDSSMFKRIPATLLVIPRMHKTARDYMKINNNLYYQLNGSLTP